MKGKPMQKIPKGIWILGCIGLSNLIVQIWLMFNVEGGGAA